MEKKYKIKYLPLFYNDLDKITDYIIYKLNNEIAANNFVNELENENDIDYLLDKCSHVSCGYSFVSPHIKDI